MAKEQKTQTVTYQVVEFIKSNIISGEFTSGNRLPPVRQLAKMVGVSSYPVQSAIAQLSKQGIVDSVRGSGVYVSKDALVKLIGDYPVKKRKKNVAVLSMFHLYDGGVAIEHGSTAKGLLEECEKVSIRPSLISPFVHLDDPQLLVKELKEGEYDGVLWLYPDKKYINSVKAIVKAKIPVVVTSHEPFELNIPVIEENIYVMAEKVKTYLRDSGCKKLIYFVYPYRDAFMNGISQLYHDSFDIETVQLPYGGDFYRKKLIESLLSYEPGCGVFITNNRDLRAFYSDSPDELSRLLGRHNFVITTDESVYDNLMPLLGENKALVVLRRFHSIGKLAAQKLSVVLDGKLENTTTLVPLELFDIGNEKR
ncbi:MAG: GntR family transcriptional regulator [Sedimentisphaeraceae bacterium JB056]